MKKIIFTLLLPLSLLFAYVDNDMDGVADSIDRCPNTPFTDLVDIQGCTTKSLVSNSHFDIIAGATYSDSDYQTLNKTDTYASTFQIDYYYKNFSLQASTSYFSTEGNNYSDSGMYDSFIGAAYQFKLLQNFHLRTSVGAILPTYSTSLQNNNTDYLAGLSLSYNLKSMNLFAGFTYTMINDDDYVDTNNTILYQNTNAYNFGVGYNFTSKFYMSSAYNVGNSIYKNVKDIQTASLYGYYQIDEYWFSTFSYAYGVSDTASKNYVSLRLGYFF